MVTTISDFEGEKLPDLKLRGVTNGRVDSYLTSLPLVHTGKMEILSDGSTVKIAD